MEKFLSRAHCDFFTDTNTVAIRDYVVDQEYQTVDYQVQDYLRQEFVLSGGNFGQWIEHMIDTEGGIINSVSFHVVSLLGALSGDSNNSCVYSDCICEFFCSV